MIHFKIYKPTIYKFHLTTNIRDPIFLLSYLVSSKIISQPETCCSWFELTKSTPRKGAIFKNQIY